MKKIIQKGNKVLRQKAKEIPLDEISSKKIKTLIKDMKEALAQEQDGVALAAPQIAVSLRLFIISPLVYNMVEKEKLPELVFINPEIIKKSKDQKKMDEGCLSVRPWYGKVRRSSRATIRAYNEKGEMFELEGTGLIAQIFQHEIDHFEGILFVDKAKDLIEMKIND